ncbi:MAG: hypothetical protein LBP85_02710 [Prevotellaceae bacterium]|nr:hypothetical protein [Prevotellaceae bacterium]
MNKTNYPTNLTEKQYGVIKKIIIKKTQEQKIFVSVVLLIYLTVSRLTCSLINRNRRMLKRYIRFM